MPRKTVARSAAQELIERVNGTLKSNVVTLGSDPALAISRVPTGSLVLDRLTYGGFARGRHVVLYGDYSVAKSLTLYRTLALAQQRGETTALIDGENVFNAEWFRQLGGDPDNLALYPDRSDDGQSKRDANELGNVLRTMIQRGEGIRPADIVGIDSVASLSTLEELGHDLEDGDVRVASLGRLMSILLRMLTTQNNKTLFIWTNQWRDKISHIPGQKSTPGGRALGFYAATMIEMTEGPKETIEREVTRAGKPTKRKMVTGRWITCTLAKEKTGARPWDVRTFLLDMETRMPDAVRELIDLGVEDGIIEYRGSRYYLEDADGQQRSAHGTNQLVQMIADDGGLREFLTNCVEEKTYELSAREE